MTDTGTSTFDDAVREARDLVSEDGENPEYDRAIYELLARIWGVPGMFTDDRAAEIEQLVRESKA